jgi:hypothetical protein
MNELLYSVDVEVGWAVSVEALEEPVDDPVSVVATVSGDFQDLSGLWVWSGGWKADCDNRGLVLRGVAGDG